jgi:hypothetical protein
LKNRINDEKLHLDNVGLVIIDDHLQLIPKLLSSFTNAFILGVTATLSSNIIPMHVKSYDELIVGDTINSLIDGFWQKHHIQLCVGSSHSEGGN